MSYFEDLQHDWDRLGFFLDDKSDFEQVVRPDEIKSYDNLHYVLFSLAMNVDAADEANKNLIGVATEVLKLRTELAKHAVNMCQLGEFHRVPQYICPDVDRLLAYSMQPKRIADPEKDSPIFVTRDQTAIGIVKQLGDINYFALRDDEETATHAGNLYRLELSRSWMQPFRRESWEMTGAHNRKILADHALTIAMEDISEYLYAGIQFSVYQTPVDARAQLTSTSDDRRERRAELLALSTSHEDMLDIAESSLPTAEPILLGWEHHPYSLPDGWQQMLIDGKYQLVRC